MTSDIEDREKYKENMWSTSKEPKIIGKVSYA